MIQIGKYTPAHNGRDAIVQREFYGQGYIVKDEVAFLHHPDQVCYVPELSDEAYTHEDFLRICDNQELLAQLCFYAVDWQAPETWYDEQFYLGEFVRCEVCGRVYDAGDHDSCPHCVNEQKGDGPMDQTNRPISAHIQRATLCPRCGQPVIPSDNPEYRYQCLNCDEDFYMFEVIVPEKEG